MFKGVKHLIRRFMDKVIPARYDGWLRIYLTLECNLKCPYCVNLHNAADSKASEYKLMNWERWAEAINKAGRNVIFTGGEPFLYADLIKLINAVNPEIKIKIYTNLCAPVDEFVKALKRPVTLFASYHPSGVRVEKFIQNLNLLKGSDKAAVTIHMVGWRKQKELLMKVKKEFSKSGYYVYIDDDQYLISDAASMLFRKKASCTKKIALIAPDGNRFHCVSKMLRMKESGKSILDGIPSGDEFTTLCDEYGYCSPCDNLGETKIQIL
jgi:organic radical activating enzyme